MNDSMSRAIKRLLFLCCLNLAGCANLDRLKDIGKAPPLSGIDVPTSRTGYRPVKMPMPYKSTQVSHHEPNSLWKAGSRGFFKDQRARTVGDILTVRVSITDSATINNQTQRSRKGSEGFGFGGLFGLEKQVPKVLGEDVSSSSLVDGSSNSSSQGAGSVQRQEKLATSIAAIVTRILPNGNMVIEGKQEVRVNFEVRELIVAGVIRPEDIEANNTIDSNKIAEARISYGGRGQITDVQQPRYGQQALDILLPF